MRREYDAVRRSMRRCRGQELGQGIVRCLAGELDPPIGVHLVSDGIRLLGARPELCSAAGWRQSLRFWRFVPRDEKGLDAPGSGSPVKGGAMTLAPGASRPWAFRRSGHRNAAQGRLRTGQGADEAIDRCRSGARRRPVAGLASPNRLECLARPHGRPASGPQLYVRS